MTVVIINLIFLIISCGLLIKATDVIIFSLKDLSRLTRIGEFAVTGIIIGLATSLPELILGVVSSLEGKPHLSLGNILGSNIANLSLVVGGAAFLGGAVSIRGDLLFKEISYVFVITLVPLLLFLDKSLSRVDGLILLVSYLFYWLVLARKKEEKIEGDWLWRIIRRIRFSAQNHKILWLKFFGGILLLLISAEAILKISTAISSFLNIEVFLVGLILLSIGTTLPELTFEFKAIKKRESEMVFGNLLGSIAANSLLILGVVSFIYPIILTSFEDYLRPFVLFVLIFLLFWFFVRTKRRLDRWEGGILVLLYLGFIITVLS